MRNNEYEYVVDGNDVYINIYQRNNTKHTTIIDLCNLEKFLNFQYSWGVAFHKCIDKYYVVATTYINKDKEKNKRYKRIYLHKFLLDTPNVEHIDHINNDTMDNRFSNLRASETNENLKNRRSKNKNNKTGYRNVCFYQGWYLVQLQIDGKNKILSKFKDVDEAGRFAEEMRKLYYGEFAGDN